MFFMALTGGNDNVAGLVAWIYVGLRVLHSVVQATINRVVVRFSIFAIATLVLVAFAVREVLRILA